MAGPRLLTQPEAPSSVAETPTSGGEVIETEERELRLQNTALREQTQRNEEAKKAEKAAETQVLLQTARQEAYNWALLERKGAAAAVLVVEERSLRLQIWSWKAEVAQEVARRGEGSATEKAAEGKEASQADCWDEKIQPRMRVLQRMLARLETVTDLTASTVTTPESPPQYEQGGEYTPTEKCAQTRNPSW